MLFSILLKFLCGRKVLGEVVDSLFGAHLDWVLTAGESARSILRQLFERWEPVKSAPLLTQWVVDVFDLNSRVRCSYVKLLIFTIFKPWMMIATV